jgi:serine/threonine protein kinase/HEAT repeat protein
MQLGPYQVLRPLAEDSLGLIFVAGTPKEPVLVRRLEPELLGEPQALERLRAWAARMREPMAAGLVGVTEVLPQADHCALVVMPLPAGTSLAELFLHRSTLADRTGASRMTPLPGALSIAQRVAEALAAAHSRGSCHLRLSSDKVFLDTVSEGGELRVFVLELGLLAALAAGAAPPAIQSSAHKTYLAPEQKGSAAQPAVLGDARSDVYALGVLLVQLLTGQLPDRPEWSAAVAQLQGSTTPAGISALVSSMLAEEPAQRPSMLQVEAVLRLAAQAQGSGPLHSQLLAYQGTLAGPLEPDPRGTQVEVVVTAAAEDPLLGTLMGNFRLVRKLGEGGMGVVYEAEHQQIGHRAAVKVLHNEFAHSPDYAKRFLNEARAVNIIRHPSLVEIFEYGQQPDGSLYIVMEFLGGASLYKRTCDSGLRMAPTQVAELGIQIARALATAHEKGVIHRDLKPENIMLVPDPVRPDQERVKILDFGIAKLQRRGTPEPTAGPGGKTGVGAVMGTPLYMAPEQFGQAESVEGAADVFALGVIFYELLAGRRPYENDSLSVLSRPIEPLQKVSPAVPPRLAALTMEMLDIAPQRRPTMQQVAERLAPLVQAPPSRSSPLRYALLGSLAAAVILTLSFVLLSGRSTLTPAQARQIALKALRAGLHAQAAEERQLAIKALGLSRDPAQLELLTPLLTDPTVAGPVARALGNLGAVSAQPALLQLLESTADGQLRLEAATALAQLENPAGTTALHTMLGQADGVLQIESALRLLEQDDLAGAQLLHRLTDSEAAPPARVLPVLAALSRAGDQQARQQLSQLAATKPLSMDPLLLYSLARSGDAVAQTRLGALALAAGAEQVLAARFLASLGQDVGYELLLQKSGDTKQPDAVREIAIEGLADRGRFDAAAPLASVVLGAESKRLSLTAAGAILRLAAGEPSRRAEQSLAWSRLALDSDSAAMRELAVGLLGDVENDASVPPLQQALHDRESQVRCAAAKVLGRKHVRAALEALRDSLEDADSEVRAAGMRSIGQVVTALHRRGDHNPEQLVKQQLLKLAHNGDEIDRVVASGILLQTGDAAQKETLSAGLRSPSALVRRLAMELIEPEPQLLRAGLTDPDRRVRLVAARRLVGLGVADAKATLRELAGGSDEAALIAYGILRKLGEAVAEPPELVRLLKGGSLRERIAVVEGLGELPAALALRLLRVASSDPSPVLRQYAAESAYDLANKTGQTAFRNLLFSLSSDTNLAVRMNVAELLARLAKSPSLQTEPQTPEPPPARAPGSAAGSATRTRRCATPRGSIGVTSAAPARDTCNSACTAAARPAPGASSISRPLPPRRAGSTCSGTERATPTSPTSRRRWRSVSPPPPRVGRPAPQRASRSGCAATGRRARCCSSGDTAERPNPICA